MTAYRIAADVAWVSREELDHGTEPTAYLTRLPDGPALALSGSACLVWVSIRDGGTVPEIAQRVGELADVSTENVRADVERLLADLAEAGVVSVEPAGGVRR
ncbi:MAG: PqqD family protein [Nocardioides sp.]|uniref:PqqD family protein n=1 Tax=Nocardioides sp. TaxID=35761 RepID=UPI0032673CBA